MKKLLAALAILAVGLLTLTSDVRAETTPPPLPAREDRVVLFIQGINSESICQDLNPPNGEDRFLDRAPGWLEPSFARPWITNKVNIVEFVYFSYNSGYCNDGKGQNGAVPEYGRLDTCSGPIDGAYFQSLKTLVQDVTDKFPGSRVTIVGHSQGGFIAAYFVGHLRNADPGFLAQRVASVIIFDSFPRGLNILEIAGFRIVFGGVCRPVSDVFNDWNEASKVAQTARDAAKPFTFNQKQRQIRFYTIDAAGPPVRESHTRIAGETLHQQFAGNHSDVWNVPAVGLEPALAKSNFIACGVMLLLQCAFQEARAAPGQTTQTQIAVAPSSQRIWFTSSFESPVQMTLRSPDGTVYGPDGAGPVAAYGVDKVSETYVIESPAPGDWTVELSGADSAPEGGPVRIALTVEEVAEPINLAPSADASSSPEGSQDLSVAINASESFDPDFRDTLTYSFDCTNDGVFEATGQAASAFDCSYPGSGLFTARVRVKDSRGLTDEATTPVTIADQQ